MIATVTAIWKQSSVCSEKNKKLLKNVEPCIKTSPRFFVGKNRTPNHKPEEISDRKGLQANVKSCIIIQNRMLEADME